MSQPTISTYFKRNPSNKKRSLSPIDLTADDETLEHTPKKLKPSCPSPRSPTAPIDGFEQWSLTSLRESTTNISSPEEAQMKAQRREAFKAKLSMDMPLSGKSSLDAIHAFEENEEEEELYSDCHTDKQTAVTIPRTKKTKAQETGSYTPLEMQVG
jgi:hypothetical protein